MTRNDSAHSILVMWNGDPTKQHAQESLQDATEAIGLGFDAGFSGTEIPDDVSILGGGSQRGKHNLVQTR